MKRPVPFLNIGSFCRFILSVLLFTPLATPQAADLFDKSNLAAWCIVPFDTNKRSPEARAEVVAKLGFKNHRCIASDRPPAWYSWRG
jgi:hypothetical protein